MKTTNTRSPAVALINDYLGNNILQSL